MTLKHKTGYTTAMSRRVHADPNCQSLDPDKDKYEKTGGALERLVAHYGWCGRCATDDNPSQRGGWNARD